jgi:2-oxo-4-hydroxy-4-carboxy--5-ureidoimidazoline (OHCU) decarboxylase
MTEPTPLSDEALATEREIMRLTRQLEDETSTESRAAISEQIEIAKARLANEFPPRTEPLP